MNLYQINQELQDGMTALGEMLEAGETPPQSIIDELLNLKSDLSDKLVNYGKFVKNTQADIDSLDGEIKRLTARKKVLQNRTDILKHSMLQAMLDNNIDRIDDPVMPIRLQNSPAAVQLSVSADDLPDEFKKVEIKANNTALAKALKAGAVIAGAALVQHKHIRIG
ncbi:siphovirus Gp157 family protein [Moraxella sp. ZJ142]|uniref:siphovirus Gp157 family protein n=1 Tax=Moraxella marmotae TaxID=3344520 RepID=UPI0035D47D26